MTIIETMDTIVSKLMGSQVYDTSKTYSLSKYIRRVELESKLLVLNCVTGAIFLFNQNENIDNPDNGLLEHLVYNWLYIDDSIDIYDKIKMRQNHMDTIRKNVMSPFQSSFVVATTMACNAACTYCYEAGVYPRSMDKDTALDVAKYIYENSIDGVKLTWFGGEPLCNSEAIRTITSYLKEKNRNFISSIITNGYLLDQFSPIELKEQWCVDYCQISLDGMDEVYNLTKRFKLQNANHFRKVLNNIEHLLKNDMRVSIRLNVSLTNYNSISELLDYILDRFYGKESYRFRLYCAALYVGLGDPPLELSIEEQILLGNYVISLQKHLAYYNRFKPRNIIDLSNQQCMMDSYKTKAIGVNGNLCICEHYLEETKFGTVTDNIDDIALFDEYNSRVAYGDRFNDCKECFYFPMCRKLTHCPVVSNCNICDKIIDWNILDHCIIEAYNNFTNTNNKNNLVPIVTSSDPNAVITIGECNDN